MKRVNPMGSLLGVVLTILLFVGLGISLWYDRGLAFNPGPVTEVSKAGFTIKGFASHAEFEKQCSYCHEPFTSNLANKCLECHTLIQQQIQAGTGAHSHVKNVNGCGSCHPEHRGRGFNPTLASYQLFDHSNTGFSLNWHQANYDATPMTCKECHSSEKFIAIDNQTCLECHSSQDNKFSPTHVTDYGSNCLGCHDGVDRMRNFDHGKTGYALEGKHIEITCTKCHTTDNLKDTPKDCSSCHAEPTIHQGLFKQTCDTCHVPISWTSANFDGKPFNHLERAKFSLALHLADYSKEAISCTTCHPSDLNKLDVQTCIDCHSRHDQAFMTDHVSQFGNRCMVCHDGVDRLSNFDHANFFPLDGKHVEIQCSDCHANQVFRGTQSECYQCHQEPEIHAGVFGLKCFYCHGTEAWSPANLKEHVFPLNHGLPDANTQLQCETCHGANYFEYTCYKCHDHQPDEIVSSHKSLNLSDQELAACAKCHPAGTEESSEHEP